MNGQNDGGREVVSLAGSSPSRVRGILSVLVCSLLSSCFIHIPISHSSPECLCFFSGRERLEDGEKESRGMNNGDPPTFSSYLCNLSYLSV